MTLVLHASAREKGKLHAKCDFEKRSLGLTAAC
jgi:hypothetical protein